MKTGLIMEGGAMRGLFTAGILDVFMENGVEFDGGGGISAGAVFGGNFKSRQIGRTIRYNTRYCKDWRYCSVKSLLLTGDLYGVDFCYREIPDHLDPFDREAFRDNPMEFYIGATDVETGKVVYHKCTDGGETDIRWMQASASMPLVSRVVDINGRKYLDGGVVDALPYPYLTTKGYDRNVLILTRPKGYRKKKSAALPLMKGILREYPKAYEAMQLRPKRYNRQMDLIDRDEAEGKILVMRPAESLNISRTESDPAELERVYQLGRQEAWRRLDEIREFLKKE